MPAAPLTYVSRALACVTVTNSDGNHLVLYHARAFKLLITEPEGARMVRRMTFFYYPHRITELTALRNTRSLWIQVGGLACTQASE